MAQALTFKVFGRQSTKAEIGRASWGLLPRRRRGGAGENGLRGQPGGGGAVKRSGSGGGGWAAKHRSRLRVSPIINDSDIIHKKLCIKVHASHA